MTTYSPEIWADIPGFEGAYQASTLGNIRSVDRVVANSGGGTRRIKGKPLKPRKTGNYLSVCLMLNKAKRYYYVHRLVAATFLIAREGELEVNHRSTDKHDNSVTNLEWVTPLANKSHAYNAGLTNFQRQARADNKSGYPGVAKHGDGWTAVIQINGVKKYLGKYNCIEEAVAARKQAEEGIHFGKETFVR